MSYTYLTGPYKEDSVSSKLYQTLSDYVAYVESLPLASDDDCETGHNGFEWQGGLPLSQVMDLARFGWPDGTRKASALVQQIANRIVAKSAIGQVENIGYDVIGAAYDAGAYALGMPEAWGVMQPQVAKRAIRIVVNAMASGGVPASALLSRGVAAAALVLALQAQGYPVTVDIFHTARLEDAVTVRVADASTGSQLDVDRVVFAVAHPGMLRCLFRAGTGRAKGRMYWWDAGTAYSNTKPESDIDLFLGGAHLAEASRWQDGGEAWILAEYKRQTGS